MRGVRIGVHSEIKLIKMTDKELKNEFKKIGGEFKRINKRLDNTLTRDDAKNFATKYDLKNLATKDDLKKYLTRDDAKNLLVTRLDFEEFKEYVEENMFTRKEWLEYIHTFNDALQEIRDTRTNRLIFEKQFVELDDTVAGHGKRITKIEHKIGAL